MGGGSGGGSTAPQNVTQVNSSAPWAGQQPILSDFYSALKQYAYGGGDMEFARTAPWIHNLLPVSPGFDETTQRMRDVGSSLYTNPREGINPGIQAQMQQLIGSGMNAPGQLFQAGSGLMGEASPQKKTIRELTGKSRQDWLNPQDDPYMQKMMKAATRPVMSSLREELAGLGSRASMQGAMGGSRQMLLEAQAIKGAGRQMGDIRAGMLMDAARRGEAAIAGGKQTQLADLSQQREHGLRRIATGADFMKTGGQMGLLQSNLLSSLQQMMTSGQDRQLNDILRGIDLTGGAADRDTGQTREQLAEQNRRYKEFGYGPLDYLTRFSQAMSGMPSFGTTTSTGPNPNATAGSSRSGLGSGIGGALGGGQMGSVFGPWGTAAGALLGGLLGAFS